MQPEVNGYATVDEDAGIVVVEAYYESTGISIRTVGSSKASQGDKFDLQTGYELAFGRALRKLGRQLISDGYDRVREQDQIKQSQRAAIERKRSARTRQLEYLRSGFLVMKGFLGTKEIDEKGESDG